MARDIRERLRDAPIPDEHGARERGWRVVSAAYADRRPVTQPARSPSAGRDRRRPGGSHPGTGADPRRREGRRPGARRRQAEREGGDASHIPAAAGRSPGRLFTGAVGSAPGRVATPPGRLRAGELVPARLLRRRDERRISCLAVEPDGTVRWSLNRHASARSPLAAGHGVRIAYRAGTSMRVVGGDGIGDHLLDRQRGSDAPGLGNAASGGKVEEVESASTCSRSRSRTGASRRSTPSRATSSGALARERCPRSWTGPPDGSWLTALSATRLRVVHGSGQSRSHRAPPAAACAPRMAPSRERVGLSPSRRPSERRTGGAARRSSSRWGPRTRKPRALLADPGTFSGPRVVAGRPLAARGVAGCRRMAVRATAAPGSRRHGREHHPAVRPERRSRRVRGLPAPRGLVLHLGGRG